MVDCPDCDLSFDHERALNSHYGQTHGGSWKTVEIECEYCFDAFEIKPSRKDRARFCSSECLDNYRSENIVGENHHQWEQVRRPCKTCGDEFYYKPSTDRLFCSKTCYTKWQRDSDYMKGENSPRWNPDKDTTWYGSNWPEQRDKRLERDGYQCVVCEMSNAEHKERNGQALEVHHIQPKSEFVEDGELDEKRANRIENLITLCRACHDRWEGIPLRPQS